MTNKEYLIKVLKEELDDDGAMEAWVYYHVACPYFWGDKRAHCKDDAKPSRDRCSECKFEWLEMVVDE